ncbi:Bone morphogenetic protein 2 [Taenia solium]|eukprot:TsM_000538200 transcript=TsM_000538200 gene=TsM_000538200
MGDARESGGTLTRLVVVGLLLQAAQNAVTVGSGTRGINEIFVSRNHPRYVRTSNVKKRRYFESGVPDYLLQLRERHSREWMNFGQADGGHGPSLGVITTIRHHRTIGSSGRQSQWQKQQNLDFRLARFSVDEQLIACSLRLPIRGRINTSIPISVRVSGAGESLRGEVYLEAAGTSGQRQKAWLNVPLPPASLYNLLRQRRLLRLRVDLADTSVIDTSPTPHLLTFHRSRERTERLRRARRDAGVNVNLQFVNQENPVKPFRGNRKKRRGRLKSKSWTSDQEKHNSRYFMNQRYIASTCQRRDLMVNFNAVGWSRWVIAPTAYNAGYCFGYCPFPLSAHFNTTNHAIIIHLMYNLRVAPPQVKPPCCTPLTFSPQSILFFDGDEVVLQVFEDMIVETCGCRSVLGQLI